MRRAGHCAFFPPGSAGQAGVESWTPDIEHHVDTPGEFRGEADKRHPIENRDDVFSLHSKGGKTSDELVARWDEEHPDDPVE